MSTGSQAARQSGSLSTTISCCSSVIQQLDVDPGGKKKGRWGGDKPDVGSMQGLALCQSHSSIALPGIPAGLGVAQHVRTAVTRGQGEMKSQANRLMAAQIQQENSVTSPLDPADFYKSQKVAQSPPDSAPPSS